MSQQNDVSLALMNQLGETGKGGGSGKGTISLAQFCSMKDNPASRLQ
jgi:hypothetical protein